jgi:chromosome segregation protein
LGEQSARSLRGKHMGDMIFNGSSTRKASGVAQVDLVFDNSDRALPLDADEVTVTRKLYRSGESEYLLCRESARLKDIRELFLDTGVGTDAYSIIEQGKVDFMLLSSPTDRRVIFEEAAGISKYKARKREAERKLERTQQNLLRVGDVIDELEKRLRSVKLAAGKARNYQTYDARLRELRASYSLAEYHRLTEQFAQLTRACDSASDRAIGLQTTIDRCEAEASQVARQLDGVGAELATCENGIVQAQSEAGTLEERAAHAARRIEEQTLHLGKICERSVAGEERLTDLHQQLDQVQQQAQELQERTHAQNLLINRLHEEDQELARVLTMTQARLEDEKAGVIDLLRRTAHLNNELASLDTHCDRLSDQRGRLSARDAEITAELTGILRRKSDLEQRLAEIDELIAAETRRLEEKKQDATRVDSVREQLVRELAEAKEARSGLLSRRQVLHDLQRKMEGVGAGVRKMLELRGSAPDHAAPAAVHGLLADLVDADVFYARIVEAALGELDQLLVVTDSQRFLDDPALFDDLPGRLTAICLDRLPPLVNPTSDWRVEHDAGTDEGGAELIPVKLMPGYVADALSLVRFPEEFERLARHLLGKTIVVDTLENALGMARDDVNGLRFVTLAGAVVEPNGCVSLGPPSTAAGLISRKSELRSVDEQLAALERHIEALADQANRTAAEASHLAHLQQELRTAIYEASTARVEVNAAIQNVAETIRRLTSEQPLVAGEVAAIERQLAEAADRARQSKEHLATLERENAERERMVAELAGKIDALVTQRSAVHEQLTEARVAAGQLSEKRNAAADTINTLRREARTAEEALSVAQHESEQALARIDESEEIVLTARQRLADLHLTIGRRGADALQYRHQRELLRVEAEQLAAAIKTARVELQQVEQALHAAQVALREATVRRDELVTRVRDELGIDLAGQYASYAHAEQDWAAIETEISELRGKIERLGHVNLDAIAEQEELEQRFNFLAGQRDDLNASHRQLSELIEQLNRESMERFRTVFEQIRVNFQELFRKLFGGGKADIVLENPDDILESGIEIVAKPPGKELQSIMLLSGGEKTMTAIALLMSVFKSRPSPFAIMDEVDAALDEANNDRFNLIVQEFLEYSQFIIITHSKRTMSMADQLYGITMQEPGVSTRVSVKFDSAAA